MKSKSPLIALSLALTTLGSQAFSLSDYQLVHTYALPAVAASEASAVTYNWDNGHLYVLGDEGDAMVEITTSGATVSTMTLTGFDDTEGLTYLGGGKFGLTEERLQDVFRLTYVAGGTVSRGSLASVSFGGTVGNIGLEGIAFEPATGLFFGVKEKTTQDVYQVTSVNFDLGTANVGHPFVPNFGVLDLADVEVLSKVTSLTGTDHQDNLLIYSQESSRLLEVNRTTGAVISHFDLTGVDNAEGVTVDPSGNIYIVGENPSLYVLSPVPEPSSAVLLLIGLGLGGFCLRRKFSPVS